MKRYKNYPTEKFYSTLHPLQHLIQHHVFINFSLTIVILYQEPLFIGLIHSFS